MDLNSQIDPQSENGCDSRKITAIKSAISQKILTDEDPLILFYDLKRFKNAFKDAVDSFPSHFVHTMAIKANCVGALMKIAKECGVGFEAASLGELMQAIHICGDQPQKIVFDSPVKTKKELRVALEKGVYLNLDNMQEFEIVKQMVETGNYKTVNIGMRVNPQVGLGTIKEMSTSGEISKFGVAFNEYKDQLYGAYKNNSWLNGIHIHVGSQGCPLDLMLSGIRRIVDIALEINERRGSQQITYIDIGGGLPVNFDSEAEYTDAAPSFQHYADLLKGKCPELFSGKFKVFTEFGRKFNAKAGFIVSRVEYTKESGSRKFAAIHAGADLFVRTIWAPTKWAIRVSVADQNGNLKQSNTKHPYDIAGPCCFSGDVIAHERVLPEIAVGDFILSHDTGAYYYSSFCFYNLRQPPPIYGFDEDATKLQLVKEGHSVESTLSFFN